MTEGSSAYSILVKMLIDKIQAQTELNEISKTLKPITIDINLATESAKAQIESIKKQLNVNPWDKVETKAFFDESGLQKYQFQVTKIADGMKTVSQHIATINAEEEISVRQIESVSSATTELNAIERQQYDLYQLQEKQIKAKNAAIEKIRTTSDKYLGQLEMLKAKNKDAFSTSEIKKLESEFRNLVDSFTKGSATSADVTAGFNKIQVATEKMNNSFRSTTSQADNFGTILVKDIVKVAEWMAATTVLIGTLREIREGFEYIIELNKEMTGIQLVTGMDSSEISDLSNQYNNLANQLGSTTEEVAKGSLEWIRQGKSVKETSDLLVASTKLSKLGNMEAAEATEYLTSTLNGFKLEAEDAASVIDKLVALDNNYATSVAEIASGLQRSANSAQQAGVSFDELASYITVVSSVTRKSAESIGESFKTMFARMENIKLGKMFEDDATTINDVEKALSLVDISIRDSETSFRSMSAVFDDVAAKWDTMNELEQSAVANAIAGKL